MQERYLCRAKRIDNEEWVYGLPSYGQGGKIGEIEVWDGADTTFYAVDPSTICQCTGIKDKNSKLIWKNDIVRHYNDEEHPESYCIGVVLWDDNYAGFYRTDNKYRDEKPRISNRCRYEVIGNTFDNPELLEV